VTFGEDLGEFLGAQRWSWHPPIVVGAGGLATDVLTECLLGDSGLLEQIMFSEDSMRGLVTVRALDNDPKEGKIFVARWEFNLDP
jgi:hypothetical protein